MHNSSFVMQKSSCFNAKVTLFSSQKGAKSTAAINFDIKFIIVNSKFIMFNAKIITKVNPSEK